MDQVSFSGGHYCVYSQSGLSFCNLLLLVLHIVYEPNIVLSSQVLNHSHCLSQLALICNVFLWRNDRTSVVRKQCEALIGSVSGVLVTHRMGERMSRQRQRMSPARRWPLQYLYGMKVLVVVVVEVNVNHVPPTRTRAHQACAYISYGYSCCTKSVEAYSPHHVSPTKRLQNCPADIMYASVCNCVWRVKLGQPVHCWPIPSL